MVGMPVGGVKRPLQGLTGDERKSVAGFLKETGLLKAEFEKLPKPRAVQGSVKHYRMLIESEWVDSNRGGDH